MLEEKNLGPKQNKDGESQKEINVDIDSKNRMDFTGFVRNGKDGEECSQFNSTGINYNQENDQVQEEPRISLKKLFFQEAGKTRENSELDENMDNSVDEQNVNPENSEKREEGRMTLKELFEKQQAKMEVNQDMENKNEINNNLQNIEPSPEHGKMDRSLLDKNKWEQQDKNRNIEAIAQEYIPIEKQPSKSEIEESNNQIEDEKIDLETVQNIVATVLNSERAQNNLSGKQSFEDSKASLGEDSLPETFEELVAESPQWKPLIQDIPEKVRKGTIMSAIYELYDGQQPDFTFPILNDEDKEITDFDVSNGIYVYTRREPFDHWHFITNKLSDLYETLWDGPKLSGVGFELTFRLRKKEGETAPPEWAVAFIQSLSGYAYSSGNFMANGHVLSVSGISNKQIGDALKAIAIVYDCEILPIDTTAGKREFLQVFGIHVDEQIAMQAWNSLKVMELISRHVSMFITEPTRRSLVGNKEFDKAINDGVNKDGSNTGVLFSDTLRWKREKGFLFKKYIIRMDQGVAHAIKAVIRGRIPKGRDLIISGNECKMIFKPSPKSYAKLDEEQLEIGISPKSYHDLVYKLSSKVKGFYIISLGGVKFLVGR